jgi:hypothetical protein
VQKEAQSTGTKSKLNHLSATYRYLLCPWYKTSSTSITGFKKILASLNYSIEDLPSMLIMAMTKSKKIANINMLPL